jgi:hypothetical protein
MKINFLKEGNKLIPVAEKDGRPDRNDPVENVIKTTVSSGQEEQTIMTITVTVAEKAEGES